MKARSSLRNWTEYVAFRAIQMLVAAFPIRWVGGALHGILRFIFRVWWPLRDETTARVREVFGADTPVERVRVIARTSVWNMVMNFVELFHARRMDLDYLANQVFAGQAVTTLASEAADVEGFNAFIRRYSEGLAVERAAVEHI